MPRTLALRVKNYYHNKGKADRQGLTLLHFSAHPEPFLTQITP